ncbi:MAG: hypothetical protein FWF96_02220 [Kiritimatiellaeota bacterium]|nr:hypothetical protein [Kiritimatiellota bacterium]
MGRGAAGAEHDAADVGARHAHDLGGPQLARHDDAAALEPGGVRLREVVE